MKKIICYLLIMCLCLCGCAESNVPMVEDMPGGADTVGVWITAFELNEMLKSENGFLKEFSVALDFLENKGVNCLYVHTRAYSDAYYPSLFYPLAAAVPENMDPLKIMVEQTHQRNMKIFAWINPYRISTSTSDKATVNGKIISAVGESNILTDKKGLYLDPSSDLVRRLIINGVREIVQSYKIDGIHFDDYFYPTAEPFFDESSYEKYKETAKEPLSLGDWRRANVNGLLSGVYGTIKSQDENILFSISPAADIKGNYENLFADVRAWCDGGYVDEIVPQLYFGFEYPAERFRFDSLLTAWQEYLRGTKVRILIGLPVYKKFTRPQADEVEWAKYDDIIPRQIAHIKENSKEIGYVYFSYSYLKQN